jgi:hypothetical protein
LIPLTIDFRSCSGVSLGMTSSLSFPANISEALSWCGIGDCGLMPDC